jgi:flagellar protein FlbT
MMAGLKLRLKANERVLINGTVVQNGNRANELSIMSRGAHILRLRDALHPGDARTPVKRVYYVAQLAVAGEVDEAEALEQFARGIHQLRQVLLDNRSQCALAEALAEAQAHNFYKSMQALRPLIPLEERLFAHGATDQPRLPPPVPSEAPICSA